MDLTFMTRRWEELKLKQASPNQESSLKTIWCTRSAREPVPVVEVLTTTDPTTPDWDSGTSVEVLVKMVFRSLIIPFGTSALTTLSACTTTPVQTYVFQATWSVLAACTTASTRKASQASS